tara:strand:- start:199 stop:402 length:204 start_codon:yes stop_codon:yes gene_type:complete
MRKNSTMKLWEKIQKEEYLDYDNSPQNLSTINNIEPKQETIDSIVAYSCSIQVIKMKMFDKVFVTLN